MLHKKDTQENSLEIFKSSAIPVNVFLVNGIRLKGSIVSYDEHTIMLYEKTEQLIYKHAISTIMAQAESTSTNTETVNSKYQQHNYKKS